MRESCVSCAMNGNIWWFAVFRLSQDWECQTPVRKCPRRAGRDNYLHHKEGEDHRQVQN